jgi:hypothetical protein
MKKETIAYPLSRVKLEVSSSRPISQALAILGLNLPSFHPTNLTILEELQKFLHKPEVSNLFEALLLLANFSGHMSETENGFSYTSIGVLPGLRQEDLLDRMWYKPEPQSFVLSVLEFFTISGLQVYYVYTDRDGDKFLIDNLYFEVNPKIQLGTEPLKLDSFPYVSQIVNPKPTMAKV